MLVWLILLATGVYAYAGAPDREGFPLGFDTDDTTGNLTAAEDLVTELWPPDSPAARGLSADALEFDFGLESDNQDDFAALGVALIIAIVLTVAFLALQFRSLIQPLLVFLAVPFSFFGVFTLLEITDNQLSFFVMVGFIALIGVAVNNTILLVDAANQERRAGASPADAIGTAVEQRFRPLVVTTATTVAGLLPLAQRSILGSIVLARHEPLPTIAPSGFLTVTQKSSRAPWKARHKR